MKAAIYCRVSTVKQEREGYSLEAQQKRLPELAAQRGFEFGPEDIYVDVQSGASDDRPAYNRMLAKTLEGEYKAIFVVEKSRLSRTESREEEQRIISTLQAAGCVVITPFSTLDVSTLEGEFIYDVTSAVDRHERKRLKKRVADGRRMKRIKGGNPGQPPSTGYKRVYKEDGSLIYQLDEEAIKPVRIAYQMALQGRGVIAICKELQRQGHRTKHGTKIAPTTVYQWLMNPTYAGMVHVGMARGSKAKEKGMWPAEFLTASIVSLDEWERVQAILTARKYKGRGARFPLSGIIHCPSCGEAMTGTYKVSKSGPVRYYNCQPTGGFLERYCPNTHGRSIKMGVAHQLLTEALPAIMVGIKHFEKQIQAMQTNSASMVNDAIQNLQSHLKATEKRIHQNLLDQEENPSSYRAERINQLEEEIASIKNEISKARFAASTIATPDLLMLEELSGSIDPSEMELIDDIARALFTKVNYKRSGSHRNHLYTLSSVTLKWGQVLVLTGGTGVLVK